MADDRNLERPQGRSFHWDEKYRQRDNDQDAPDPFLVRALEHVRPGGRALDLACGAGRHSVELARSFEVEAVDFSVEALRLTQARCAEAGFSVRTTELDLEAPRCRLGASNNQLVAAFYFLHRDLFPAIVETVRAGGFVVYKTFTTENSRFGKGPTNSDYLLQPGELPTFFPGWRVIIYEEENEGRGTAALLAQRP